MSFIEFIFDESDFLCVECRRLDAGAMTDLLRAVMSLQEDGESPAALVGRVVQALPPGQVEIAPGADGIKAAAVMFSEEEIGFVARNGHWYDTSFSGFFEFNQRDVDHVATL